MENEKALSPPLLTYYSRTTTFRSELFKFLNGLLKEVFDSNRNKIFLNIGVWVPECADLEKPVSMLPMDLHKRVEKEEVLRYLHKRVKEVINNMSRWYRWYSGISVNYVGDVLDSDLDIWIYYHFTHDKLSELRKKYEGVDRKEKIIVIACMTSRDCIIREIQNFKIDFLCVNSPVKNSSKLVSNPSDLTEGIYNDLCGSKEDEILNYLILYRVLKIIKDNRRKVDKESIEKNFDKNTLTGERITRLNYKQYRSLLKQFKCNKDLIEDFIVSEGLVEIRGRYYLLTEKGEEYLKALRDAFDYFCGRFDEYKEIWGLIKDEKPVTLYTKGIRSKGEPKRFQSHL